jgi:hypothetical protein
MPGGLIQLAAYGAENEYLMGNPQITFFKLVYKKHTNFSIESVEVSFEGNSTISEVSQSPTTLQLKIPRVGDLLHNCFLKVNLPNIISSKYKKFKWVKHLGEVMIHSASLFIGGSKIETFTGEWIHIYNNLTNTEDKKKIYNNLIGNTKDLNEIDSFHKDLIEILNQKYSNCKEENPFYTENDDDHSNNLFNDLYNCQNPYYDPTKYDSKKGLTPSILGRILYIPIPFSFTKNIGLSLPLIALQYHDVEIQIEFSPIMKLFTILEYNNESNSYYRRRPNPLRDNHKLSYYVYTDNLTSDIPKINKRQKNNICFIESDSDTICEESETTIQHLYNNNNFYLECNLELFYIFLDENERKAFSEMSHEYLIEQVSILSNNGYHGESSSFDMNLYNPTKEMIWTLKRDDFSKYNINYNYSNLIYPDKPYWYQFSKYNEYETEDKQIPLHFTNWKKLTPHILKNAKIKFNSIDRFEYKDYNYFNNLVPYLYHTNSSQGINVYSFAVDPEKFQPSGSVNLSMISDVSLEFQTLVPPLDPEIENILKNKNININGNRNKCDNKALMNSLGLSFDEQSNNTFIKDKQIYKYTYQLDVYVISYNILKIVSGMGGLAYTK